MENNSFVNVIIESKIPFVDDRLDGIARVTRLDPDEFTPEAVAGADAIIVRTRTKVNEALLGASNVKFVATATIGTDHIDIEWCRANGIAVANAPGCNAPGVAQYVLSSVIGQGYGIGPDTTVGIVGVGHVGRIVEQWARSLGLSVLLCDPPRARMEGHEGFAGLDELAEKADIITFHTPLVKNGIDATYHLISDEFLVACQRWPLIINAARGAVADTDALIRAVEKGRVRRPVIDCWEGEPFISERLLQLAAVATPHIAGYSFEGKVRATQMALDSFTGYFGLPHARTLEGVDMSVAPSPSAASIAASYSPIADTANLLANPGAFESLRNNYSYRKEPR
ncbi:MAG: 4-phosphoerythronate dehydrogenase [Bacteroides sp.]|nr:4-phosphoerythronate dehydrogenase [Bacteroides sp.]